MSKFTITVEAESLPELADRIAALAIQLKATTTMHDPVMPEVKTATAKAKSQKGATATAVEAPAEPQPEAVEVPAVVEEPKPAPQKEPEVQKAEEKQVEQPSIRELTLQLVGAGKRPKVEAILAEFGLDKTTSVDDARKQDMINALTDALAD